MVFRAEQQIANAAEGMSVASLFPGSLHLCPDTLSPVMKLEKIITPQTFQIMSASIADRINKQVRLYLTSIVTLKDTPLLSHGKASPRRDPQISTMCEDQKRAYSVLAQVPDDHDPRHLDICPHISKLLRRKRHACD